MQHQPTTATHQRKTAHTTTRTTEAAQKYGDQNGPTSQVIAALSNLHLLILYTTYPCLRGSIRAGV
jgi:hypothetical protein